MSNASKLVVCCDEGSYETEVDEGNEESGSTG